MTKDELELLKKALNGLMASMNAKPLDEAGMAFWTLTLRDYEYEQVRSALINWAQHQRFVPRPADIVEALNRKRIDSLERQRQAIAEADRRDRQLDAQDIDVEAVIRKIHDATENAGKGTLTDKVDAYNEKYSKEELFVRTVMAETAHLGSPKIYEERAKRFLEAAKSGIKLSPMQISWAEKVLEG